MASTAPRQEVLHVSLTRPILLGGVEREIAIIEATLIAALLFGVGLHLATVGLSILIALVVHPLLRSAAKSDPQMLRVYVRHLRYAPYYAAQTHPEAPGVPVQPFTFGVR
ncbi:MAG: conjugal transfer protein TrbD [Acidobacteriota bacterium]